MIDGNFLTPVINDSPTLDEAGALPEGNPLIEYMIAELRNKILTSDGLSEEDLIEW